MSVVKLLTSLFRVGDTQPEQAKPEQAKTVAGNRKGASSHASLASGALTIEVLHIEAEKPVTPHSHSVRVDSGNEKTSYTDPATVARVCYVKIHGPNQKERLLAAIAYLEESDPLVFANQKGIELLKNVDPSPSESTGAVVHEMLLTQRSEDADDDASSTSSNQAMSGKDIDIDPQVIKDAKHIRHYLVGLCERRPDVGEGWIQSFTPSTSSETIKYNVPTFMGRLRDVANLGFCVAGNVVLFVRSARTQNTDQYRAKGAEAARAVVEANDTSKIRDKEGKKTIRRYCCTFMDASLVKGFATGVQSIKDNIKGKDVVYESERVFLEEKKQGAEQYVPLKQTVCHEWTDDKGTAHRVYEERPLVAQTVFSRLAGSSSCYAEAQAANKQSYAVLILSSSEGIRKLTDEMSDTLKPIVNYALQDLVAICKDPWSEIDKLDKTIKDLSVLREEVSLSEEDLAKLESVIAHLQAIQTLVRGSEPDPVRGSIKSFLAQMLLCNAAGFIPDIECKSGNDRTSMGATLLVCQEAFIRKNGRPMDIDRPEDFKELQKLFAKNFVPIARGNLAVSRGGGDDRPLVKVNGPVMNLLAPEGSPERDEISKHLIIGN